jgi:hypothetical protein
MPAFPFSQALTANQLGFNPLTGWQYETVPMAYVRGAAVKLLSRATTTGVRLTLYSGAQTIQQRSPVQGGGTAGVTPSELNTPPVAWIAQPGDRLIPQFDEVAGGTPTVDGVLFIEPL